jgi:monoamine oxidase
VQALSEQAARNLDDGVNYRIVGGYAQLIHGLSGGEYKVYLGMPVSVVRHFSTHCEIETLGGEKFSAAAVVIATPLTALRMGAIRFEPALREEIVTSIDALQLGHAMKVIAELNGRLDIPENYVFSHHPIHSIWKNDEGDRSHLIGFVGGQPYVNNVTDLKGGIPNAFRSMALSLFGDIKIEKIYWKTWSETPWIGYSYTHPGKVGSDSMDVLAAPNYKRLFFVGEGTATDGKLGTVSGAISSAFRAFSQYESEFE